MYVIYNYYKLHIQSNLYSFKKDWSHWLYLISLDLFIINIDSLDVAWGKRLYVVVTVDAVELFLNPIRFNSNITLTGQLLIICDNSGGPIKE